MAKSIYNLAGAYKIDILREEFDRRMADAVADCKTRPGLNKCREVSLTIKIWPAPQEPDDVLVDHAVKSKIPIREIDRYRMQTTVNNGLKFQPNSPVDPDQESLFDDEE